MKFILILLLLLFLIYPVAADKTWGTDGDKFYGNSTFNNVTDWEEGDNITSRSTIYDDFKTGLGAEWINTTNYPPASVTVTNGELTVTSNSSIADPIMSGIYYSIEEYVNSSNFTVKMKSAQTYSGPFLIENSTGYFITGGTSSPANLRAYMFVRNAATTSTSGFTAIGIAANTYYLTAIKYIGIDNVEAHYLYVNNTLIDSKLFGIWDFAEPQYVALGARSTSRTAIYDWVHNDIYVSGGNQTFVNDSGVGNEIWKLSANFSSFPIGTNVTVTTINNDTDAQLQTFTAITDTTWSQELTTTTQDMKVNITFNSDTVNTTTLEQFVMYSQVASTECIKTINITHYDPDNLTSNMLFDLNSSNCSSINVTYNATNASNEYCMIHPNGTQIGLCQVASNEGDTVYWNESVSTFTNGSGYNINESVGSSTSTIIIPANSYGIINNWTVATNFSNIATNESNDVCYAYYNVTTGEWGSYYPPYSWNSDYVIPLEASVMMFVDAQTTVTVTIVTPSSTELYTGWNMLFVEGTDNETIATIIADIGANCTDAWGYNSTAGAYSNASAYSIQPNQGFVAYITQTMTWIRSDL